MNPPEPRHPEEQPEALPTRTGADGTLQVFDNLRQRWVAFTPEEEVRQLFVRYLCRTMGYPAGRLGNEVPLVQHGRRRRCDTVVYGPDAKPVAIVEYKAPQVAVNRSVFEQIMRYALALESVKYIFVSNGRRNYCARLERDGEQKLQFLDRLPAYHELLQQAY